MTFFWIVTYAVGFALLAAMLDILTTRRPQPLSALNLALAALATLELFRVPLVMLAFYALYRATSTF
jgi:hypothetical protein